MPYRVKSTFGMSAGVLRSVQHIKLIMNAGLRLLQKFIRYCPSFTLSRFSRMSLAAVPAPRGYPQNRPINIT